VDARAYFGTHESSGLERLCKVLSAGAVMKAADRAKVIRIGRLPPPLQNLIERVGAGRLGEQA
jgi:hypothetical protein